ILAIIELLHFISILSRLFLHHLPLPPYHIYHLHRHRHHHLPFLQLQLISMAPLLPQANHLVQLRLPASRWQLAPLSVLCFQLSFALSCVWLACSAISSLFAAQERRGLSLREPRYTVSPPQSSANPRI